MAGRTRGLVLDIYCRVNAMQCMRATRLVTCFYDERDSIDISGCLLKS